MHASVVGLLNNLLELESRSLITRLGEAHPFMSWAAAEDVPVLQKIVAQETEHQRRLVEAIEQLNGVPRPASYDTLSGRLHYLDVQYLLPEIVAQEQRLIDTYRQVAERIPAAVPVGTVVSELLADHQAQLAQLQELAQRTA